jgi:hypothetical protein
MLSSGLGADAPMPPPPMVPMARASLCAVEPYVSSATFALPRAMSRLAWEAWNSYELPPTAVVSIMFV